MVSAVWAKPCTESAPSGGKSKRAEKPEVHWNLLSTSWAAGTLQHPHYQGGRDAQYRNSTAQSLLSRHPSPASHSCISVSTFHFPEQVHATGNSNKTNLVQFFFKPKINYLNCKQTLYFDLLVMCLFFRRNLSCTCVPAVDKTQGELRAEAVHSLPAASCAD